MRTVVSLAALLSLTFLTAPPAQAGYSYECHSCTPTFMTVLVHSGTHGVPDPKRIGNFIGHFDANGVPQSIVTPEETHEEIVEGPCVETSNGFLWWKD
ncbi:MAG TPA: hypothetical protein VIN06_08445 [Devosia sp.]